MAQTKRKRRSKHRGNAAGGIEARGRTGRPPSPEEKKRAAREQSRVSRLSTPPTWGSSFKRALLPAGAMFVFLLLIAHPKHGSALASALVFAVIAVALYVPAGYSLELFLYRRRMAKQNPGAKR
jgi:hypothetical protein